MMLKWVIPFMWTFCRIVGTMLQLIGFTGILLFFLIAIWEFASWI